MAKIHDVMYLYELKQALADSGVQLEALVIDACLMANLETAYAVKDSAHWMIASEEVVPGSGTAVGDWLEELYIHPEYEVDDIFTVPHVMERIEYYWDGEKAIFPDGFVWEGNVRLN